MKKHFTIVLFCWIGLVGCVGEPEKPADLIEKSEMVDLLIQIHLLEAKINKVPKRAGDSVQFLFHHYQDLLFEDMNVDSTRYHHSMAFYLDNPKELTSIYQEVVDSLALRAKNRNID